MDTSLSNGFTNLCIINYVFDRLNMNLPCFIEGDDSIFRTTLRNPDIGIFDRLGIDVKIQREPHVSHASFCGMIFDEDARDPLTNPINSMGRISYAGRSYLNARPKRLRILAYLRGLSYLYTYPGCPVTQALALCYIRLFPTTLKECNFFIQNERSLGQWMRELYMTMLEKPVVARPVRNESRYLIEQKFNISIEQQLMLEEHFNTLTDTHMIFKCGLEIAKDLTDYFCDYANQSLIHIGTRAFPRSYMPMQMTFAGFDENLSTHQMNGTIKNNSQSSRKRNPKIEKGRDALTLLHRTATAALAANSRNGSGRGATPRKAKQKRVRNNIIPRLSLTNGTKNFTHVANHALIHAPKEAGIAHMIEIEGGPLTVHEPTPALGVNVGS